jgi:hypothetical protein
MLGVHKIHRWEYLFGPAQGCDTFWQTCHLNADKPINISSALPIAKPVSECQFNIYYHHDFLTFYLKPLVFRHMPFSHTSELVQILMNAALLDSARRRCSNKPQHTACVSPADTWQHHENIRYHKMAARQILCRHQCPLRLNKLWMPVQKISPLNTQQCFKHTYRNT